MKKRIIGSIGFVIIFYTSLYIGFFPYLMLLFLLIGAYEIIKIRKNAKTTNSLLYLLFYSMIYLIGIVSLIKIYKIAPIYIFCLISGIMVNDTFAYLVGSKFGKTKFSKTSPNKSIEGVIGGVLASMIVYGIYLMTIGVDFITAFDKYTIYDQYLIIIIVLLSAIIGDLLESKLKRLTNIKDSGSIVYGHGGILDRTDSWISSGITFLLLINII